MFLVICILLILYIKLDSYIYIQNFRYQKWTPELPEELNPWNMYSIRGLRSAVIRSLFYVYSPYAKRISNEKPLSNDFSKLSKAQCVLQWQTVCIFFF